MTDKERPMVSSQSVRIVAIIQIMLGAVCVILQVVNISIGDIVGFVGTGMWCGVAFIVAGAFGLSTSQFRKQCELIAWLVFSLLSIPLTLTLLAFSAIGAWLEAVGPFDPVEPGVSTTPYPMRGEKLGLDVVLAVGGLSAFVVSITASIMSCKGICRLKQVPYDAMDSNGMRSRMEVIS